MVLSSSPRCPAIFFPGKTLAGVVFIPVDPALLCARDVPWEAGKPEKFHLFITPANPLPLDLEMMSTFCPGLKWSALSSVPSGRSPCSLFTWNSKESPRYHVSFSSFRSVKLSNNVSLVVNINDGWTLDRVQVSVDGVSPNNRSGPFHNVHGRTSVNTLEIFVVCLQFVVLLGLESGFHNLGNQFSENRMSGLGLKCPLFELDSSGHVVLPVLNVNVLFNSHHETHISIRVEPRIDRFLQVRVNISIDSSVQENQQVSRKVGLDNLVWEHLERLQHLRNGVLETDFQNLQNLLVCEQVVLVGWVLVLPLVNQLSVREIWVGGWNFPHLPDVLFDSSGTVVKWEEFSKSVCGHCSIIWISTAGFRIKSVKVVECLGDDLVFCVDRPSGRKSEQNQTQHESDENGQLSEPRRHRRRGRVNTSVRRGFAHISECKQQVVSRKLSVFQVFLILKQ